MALRIHHHVTHGELDNRERGKVVGKIWLKGMVEPLALDLAGDMCADIAGCLLTFRVTSEAVEVPPSHAPGLEQSGVVGDMTASRKVRIPDLPVIEFYEACKRGEKPPEHMGNCLYVEWYSARNGRVVLETSDFECSVSEPSWIMTEADAAARAEQSARAFEEFLGRLSDAVDRAKSKTPWEKEEWDEFDHERMLRENDARLDKYAELMDKYGDSDDAEEIIAKEMGWRDDDAEDADPEWVAERDELIRELNEAAAAEYEEPEPDPATEGKDWIRSEDGDLRHPLQHRVFEEAVALWHRLEELGLREAGHDDLDDLVFNYQTAGAKLAGALNGLCLGTCEDFGAVVALMKRALAYVHNAQAALQRLVGQGLLPPGDEEKVRADLFAIRQEMLRLMEEFRNR